MWGYMCVYVYVRGVIRNMMIRLPFNNGERDREKNERGIIGNL